MAYFKINKVPKYHLEKRKKAMKLLYQCRFYQAGLVTIPPASLNMAAGAQHKHTMATFRF